MRCFITASDCAAKDASGALKAPSHCDPRWLPILRKIGYVPEQLAKIEVTLPQAAMQ